MTRWVCGSVICGSDSEREGRRWSLRRPLPATSWITPMRSWRRRRLVPCVPLPPHPHTPNRGTPKTVVLDCAPRSPGRAARSAEAAKCVTAGTSPRLPLSVTTPPHPAFILLTRAHARKDKNQEASGMGQARPSPFFTLSHLPPLLSPAAELPTPPVDASSRLVLSLSCPLPDTRTTGSDSSFRPAADLYRRGGGGNTAADGQSSRALRSRRPRPTPIGHSRSAGWCEDA